jgi:Recombination endonuclease VII.
MHIDHDHVTGTWRGVLCFTCNAALGQLQDNPAMMRREAADVEGQVWQPTKLAPGVYRLPSSPPGVRALPTSSATTRLSCSLAAVPRRQLH